MVRSGQAETGAGRQITTLIRRLPTCVVEPFLKDPISGQDDFGAATALPFRPAIVKIISPFLTVGTAIPRPEKGHLPDPAPGILNIPFISHRTADTVSPEKLRNINQ